MIFPFTSRKKQGASGIWQFDLGSLSYDSKSFSVASQNTYPYSVFMNDTASKMYVLGYTSDTVYQYSLSTAGDVSTASYDSVSMFVGNQDGQPMDIFFIPDGTKMYMIGLSGKFINQYNLSTAWDLSTASYASKRYLLSSYIGSGIGGGSFSDDGLRLLYFSDDGYVRGFDLSIAYDVSTATYVSGYSFQYVGQFANKSYTRSSMMFSNNGDKMFLASYFNQIIYQYSLSTPYDPSSATYDSVSVDLTTEVTDMRGWTVSQDGLKLYAISRVGSTIYQYSL
tara:strand:- start:523 stop:1365 length:843 start_codon:yes stop_codon:yes gene_type:complete